MGSPPSRRTSMETRQSQVHTRFINKNQISSQKASYRLPKLYPLLLNSVGFLFIRVECLFFTVIFNFLSILSMVERLTWTLVAAASSDFSSANVASLCASTNRCRTASCAAFSFVGVCCVRCLGATEPVSRYCFKSFWIKLGATPKRRARHRCESASLT